MRNPKQQKIKRVRNKIIGSATRPRLAVFRSNKHLSAQLIDDAKGATILSAEDREIKAEKGKTADEVGKLVAKKANEKKITQAVFDRRSYKYHGKIKAVAEGARSGGLKI
jgi:large subunit ribosomal protein L18